MTAYYLLCRWLVDNRQDECLRVVLARSHDRGEMEVVEIRQLDTLCTDTDIRTTATGGRSIGAPCSAASFGRSDNGWGTVALGTTFAFRKPCEKLYMYRTT